MDIIDPIARIVGAANVLAGDAMAPWGRDWTGAYKGTPLAVVRPGSTAEVSQVMKLVHAAGIPVVPASGRTGLTGATQAEGRLVLSLDRLNRIRAVKPGPRLIVAEAGVILDRLHAAAEEVGLLFPLTFGARGSAMVGGALSTNAGGSNVLRYGSAREQCLGLEVVLADGRVLDLMTELHKDNSGYALRHLFIGGEGTLGIITAAVLKLVPRPRAYATAMVAVPSITAALDLLARLREATGGAVEAFEYMPRSYIEAHLAHIPGAREPFADPHEHNIMVEVGATAARDAEPGPDGTVPLVGLVEQVLADHMESGQVLDAVVARSEAQRREMWARRESAAEITFTQPFWVDTDIAVPLDRLEDFLGTIRRRLAEVDPEATDFVVSHLGDGNIHYTAYPTRGDKDHLATIRALVDDTAVSLGGSFSAEHGIGLSKLPAMRTHKDPVALEVMRSLKAALDPQGLLNPGKTVPAP
ncbi:FAD-binding oxidoreductase [Rubellimicrobium arenae]|uniref:FAD-binding oxidoreductase n=1 Tax=Rubellimicrobium arenae TaxID=2817372 RepID=UPI001B315786|nr:FAD-binding oxidoreductase [Rubellimicrobium arenae]